VPLDSSGVNEAPLYPLEAIEAKEPSFAGVFAVSFTCIEFIAVSREVGSPQDDGIENAPASKPDEFDLMELGNG
jgi:hypothetical protein